MGRSGGQLRERALLTVKLANLSMGRKVVKQSSLLS